MVCQFGCLVWQSEKKKIKQNEEENPEENNGGSDCRQTFSFSCLSSESHASAVSKSITFFANTCTLKFREKDNLCKTQKSLSKEAS